MVGRRVADASQNFEQALLSRKSSRQGAGLVEFHLLKGPDAEDHTLYASHAVWENRAVFEARTNSEAFRERTIGQALRLDQRSIQSLQLRDERALAIVGTKPLAVLQAARE
jgi:heme-degrading monooxygenase HmoA